MARARAAATEPEPGEEQREQEAQEAQEAPRAPAREPAPGGATQPMVDLEFVKGLIEAVDASGIDSLEITRAGTRVKISKTPPGAPPAPTYFSAAPMAAAPAPHAMGNAGSASVTAGGSGSGAGGERGGGEAMGGGAVAEQAGGKSGLSEVPSPMVGTFYRAPAPDAPPYVEVGSRVSKGQTLCILEAMKLMNELESEVEGLVREILVDNAEPVEYGQVLFRIDPNG